MKPVQLLVLGALRRRGRAHGYQVRADLESWGAHEWSTATSGSVYHALKSMAAKKLLTGHESAVSAAGGPPRIEYELTADGEREYFALLRQALSDREPSLDVLGAAIGLIEDLPRAEALEMLQRRATAMDEWRRSITEHLPPGTDLDSWGPVGEVITLWLSTADAGAAWTQRLIRRLEKGDFTMAGEASAQPGR
ncbi:PadR family transcriptional regulator [Nocardia cyriacigeorgica]|uniref:PadR family transcriptional regulator n=1 Tax=Nocardia cyriacigeorgica TaxID=135487 RepID=UPI0002D8D677|nr:PadR family transcriptional regulator [Nocardia cyriacigeorgica]MBF6496566.1 PadR family transcriptional regulator [Nocardia cyriacigeorgica]TLF58727.1 PadR family transcriptional regulator [Nocardia cyriacigeorgica]